MVLYILHAHQLKGQQKRVQLAITLWLSTHVHIHVAGSSSDYYTKVFWRLYRQCIVETRSTMYMYNKDILYNNICLYMQVLLVMLKPASNFQLKCLADNNLLCHALDDLWGRLLDVLEEWPSSLFHITKPLLSLLAGRLECSRQSTPILWLRPLPRRWPCNQSIMRVYT